MPLALRQVGALYLTAACAYAVGIVLSQHPALADRADAASMYVRVQSGEAAAALENHVLVAGWRIVRNESQVLVHNVMTAIEAPAVPPPMRVAEAFPPPGDAQFVPRPLRNTPPPGTDNFGLRMSEDNASSPPASVSEPSIKPPQRVARAARPRMELAPQTEEALPPPDTAPAATSAVPNYPQPTTTEIAQVQHRLKDNLTSEMYDNFELFLYVSKAASGPWAQRMYVFQKEPTGDLALANSWPVSTGREKIEFNASGQKLASFTPQGYFELDPRRFFTHHWSSQWDEPMPYAMFFNWKKNGHDTGIAIHAASGDDVALLGQRASAGCIRLPPEGARTLFSLIKSKYRGLAPRFAVDRRTGTMSNDGILLHDAGGHVQHAEGYKVLVFIEDYGGENVVAAMY